MTATAKHTAMVEKIADLPFYTEGPVVDDKGSIYFTTLAGGRIMKVSPGGAISEWAGSACPNGQTILAGAHLVCDVGLRAICRFDAAGRHTGHVIEKYCAGVPFHAPNDLVADAAGNIYFTDSVRHSGRVFFIGADGTQQVLASGLDYPNGLALAPLQQWLYVAESYKNRIIRINLEAPGRATGAMEIVAVLPAHSSGRETDNLPDGLAIDAKGDIWVAHYGMQAIHRLSPEGRLLSSFNTGIPLTSNLAFLDDDTIIVTGGYGEPGPGAVHLVHLPGGEPPHKTLQD